MSAGAKRVHGGRAPEGFHDFSAPINPLGTPSFLEDLIKEAVLRGAHRSYPDYEYRELREALSEFYGVDQGSIIPMNGAAEALYLAVLAFRPRFSAVIEPTFGDHSVLFNAAGIAEKPLLLREGEESFSLPQEAQEALESLPEDSILVFSNPNNPTGLLLKRKEVLELAERFKGIVIADEAFIELSDSPSESILRDAEASANIIAMRSLTKTLCIPGLRAGFAVAPKELANRLEAVRQAWNMNSIAAYAISRAFKEKAQELSEFLRRSRSTVSEERERMLSSLKAMGIHAYRSSATYILARLESIGFRELSSCLFRRRIYLRDASSFRSLTPRHFRVSVKLREENEMLIEAMRECLREAG